PILLRSEARYVGLIGSRRTQAQRREMLRRVGVTEAEMSRLHGPIGLDIGAITPEEIALAILAEMTAVKDGRSGRPPSQVHAAALAVGPRAWSWPPAVRPAWASPSNCCRIRGTPCWSGRWPPWPPVQSIPSWSFWATRRNAYSER